MKGENEPSDYHATPACCKVMICHPVPWRKLNGTSTDEAAVGNTMCAVAPSMEFLLAARAVAGIGGGGLTSGECSLLSKPKWESKIVSC
jgi:hypothetical protein